MNRLLDLRSAGHAMWLAPVWTAACWFLLSRPSPLSAQQVRVDLSPRMVTNEAEVGDPRGLVDEQRRDHWTAGWPTRNGLGAESQGLDSVPVQRLLGPGRGETLVEHLVV